MKLLIPSAEPFFIPGGPVGCLLVHGFTGTPKEMRPLGERLAEQGYTALGIRLFGHATHPHDMRRARQQDWLANVEDGYHLLTGACSRIVIMGLSMGGTLSLIFAAHHPLDGVVAMSAPAFLPPDPRLRLVGFLSLFIKEMPKGETDWADSEMERDHISYPSYPMRAISEVRDLVATFQKCLPDINVPALIIHSRHDKTVPPANAERIYQSIGSDKKEIIWLEGTGHVITRDAQRERVFGAISKFLQEISGDDS